MTTLDAISIIVFSLLLLSIDIYCHCSEIRWLPLHCFVFPTSPTPTIESIDFIWLSLCVYVCLLGFYPAVMLFCHQSTQLGIVERIGAWIETKMFLLFFCFFCIIAENSLLYRVWQRFQCRFFSSSTNSIERMWWKKKTLWRSLPKIAIVVEFTDTAIAWWRRGDRTFGVLNVMFYATYRAVQFNSFEFGGSWGKIKKI